MRWSEEAWEAGITIYHRIQELPFIKELINGTLAKEKFLFYIKQDAMYLADYGRVLTGIASKLSRAEDIEAFTRFANESISVEKALHATFLEEVERSVTNEPSPSCLFYTSYLLRQVAIAPVECVVASVLPCFWIYKKVGDYILDQQISDNNPYQSWIYTYGGEDFSKSVELAISIADRLAEQCTPEQRKLMTKSYVICSKMEWKFWDSAYKLESWEV